MNLQLAGILIAWLLAGALSGVDSSTILKVDETLSCGPAPGNRIRLQDLADMGIRTIISVDAVQPDIEASTNLGMRYVHLPLGYEEIGDRKSMLIAKAVRDLPGPIYIHCHKGIHRAPAAAAQAMVTLGRLDPAAASRIMEKAGTSRNYPGLWASVANARKAMPSQLDDIDDGMLPERAKTSSFAQGMGLADRHLLALERMARNQWQADQAHPDLSAVAEAGALTDLMRSLPQTRQGKRHEHAFSVIAAASHQLELALRYGRDDSAQLVLEQIATSCRSCHQSSRNLRMINPNPQAHQATVGTTRDQQGR